MGEITYWSTYEDEKVNANVFNTCNVSGNLDDENTFCVHCLVFKVEESRLRQSIGEIKKIMN